jgi:hypothetical protein
VLCAEFRLCAVLCTDCAEGWYAITVTELITLNSAGLFAGITSGSAVYSV